MLARTLALTCACLLGLMAGAAAQAPSATPPAASAPPPAATPPAAAPPSAAAPMQPAAPTQPAAPAPMQSAAPTPTPAAAPPIRIRGTITTVAPHKLTIHVLTGSKVDVTLTDPLTVRTLKRVPLSAISDGAYLGIASRSGPKDTRVALEVLVFPEAMRGAGAGHYPWDLQSGSMMTNAPVSAVVKHRAGRTLTLTYQGGSVDIYVPLRAPVVTFAPASVADLKHGSRVFIVAHKDADGHLAAGAVTVGTHGVNPPM